MIVTGIFCTVIKEVFFKLLMTLSLQAIRNWYSKSRNRYRQYFYNHSTISRANSPADEASAKFSSDSDIFLPLQPFHHCFTTASRRWFSGSFTIVKSRILRSLEAANSPTLPLVTTTVWLLFDNVWQLFDRSYDCLPIACQYSNCQLLARRNIKFFSPNRN